MGQIKNEDVIEYVENNIGEFHKKRLVNLETLKLKRILTRKNPYLFKAKNILATQELVKTLLDAHLSSQEETIFGDFLEGLAIYICKKVHNGWKSTSEGIDLEFDSKGIRNIISIKSGPNWGNSRQISKMKDDFNRAKKILRTSSSSLNIKAINGCCYGKDNNPDKGTYYKYCGQIFWEFISNKENLYTEIIEPLGHNAPKYNDNFAESYSQILNKFTIEFSNEFCLNGKIDWEKLVIFNSGKQVKD